MFITISVKDKNTYVGKTNKKEIGENMKKIKLMPLIFGGLIGVVNGLFGAGGGMLAVPLLKKMGFSQTDAHANAVAVILPITVVSAVLYIIRDYVEISGALIYIPTGIIGSVLGTLILKKISPFYLKKIFGFFMIYAGVRLLLR